MPLIHCYACGRLIKKNPCAVDTMDDQWVYVGPDCFGHVRDTGEHGWQPPLGGPRLFILSDLARIQYAARGRPVPGWFERSYEAVRKP